MTPELDPGSGAAAVFKNIQAGRDVTSITITPEQLAAARIATSLQQLPAPPDDFTGRGEELDDLTRRIEQEGTQRGATISGVRGMGGVGKTVLALKLAEQLAERYPDAQFYLDLRGTAKTPLTWAEAMAHVIRAYHPQQRPPDNENELRGLYRSVLHGKRALLLMDNAAGAEQVEPLIPPEGCLLLVTSRKRFTLPGLYAGDLDSLPEPEAVELLRSIAPRILEDEAKEIAELCSHLPLALRLAGSAIQGRPDLAPADYARRLSDAQTRLRLLAKVEASIALSDSLLPKDRRRLWYMLAVFPADFDRLAAAKVWDLEEDPAQDALSDLVRQSVLNWSEDTKRYHLHDLVRLYVDRFLTDPDRSAAGLRHSVHYLTLAAAADNLYRKDDDHAEKNA